MDDIVRKIVEAHLKEHLESLGVKLDRWHTVFDWDAAIIEEGGAEFQGAFVEAVSDLSVTNDCGEQIATGWTDCITTSAGNLHCFWTRLSVEGRTVVEEFGIPDWLWSALTEQDKCHIAREHQGWTQDVRMKPYRVRVVSELIRSYLCELKAEIVQFESQDLSCGFNKNLFLEVARKLISLAEAILEGSAVQHPIATETYRLGGLCDDARSRSIIEILTKLETEVRYAAMCF